MRLSEMSFSLQVPRKGDGGGAGGGRQDFTYHSAEYPSIFAIILLYYARIVHHQHFNDVRPLYGRVPAASSVSYVLPLCVLNGLTLD